MPRGVALPPHPAGNWHCAPLDERTRKDAEMGKHRALNIILSLLTGLAIFAWLALMCGTAGGVGVFDLSLIAVVACGGAYLVGTRRSRASEPVRVRTR